MLMDIGKFDTSTLAIDAVAVAASIAILKQWLRSDMRQMGATITRFQDEVSKRQDETEEELRRLDDKYSIAITKLADTVEAFVRSTADQRFAAAEQAAQRYNEIEMKVTALEVTVGRMDQNVERIANAVQSFVGKGR